MLRFRFNKKKPLRILCLGAHCDDIEIGAGGTLLRLFNDYDIERFYRAAKVLEIYEGTKEVEKIIIAREVLGKLA